MIRATKSVQTSGGRTTTTYRSARLNTLGKFGKYHGMFEARMKLVVQRGLWPAWWMVGTNFPKVGWPACGEVDMLENDGGSFVVTSIHTPNKAGTGVLTKIQQFPWMMGGISGACGGTQEPGASRSIRMGRST